MTTRRAPHRPVDNGLSTGDEPSRQPAAPATRMDTKTGPAWGRAGSFAPGPSDTYHRISGSRHRGAPLTRSPPAGTNGASPFWAKGRLGGAVSAAWPPGGAVDDGAAATASPPPHRGVRPSSRLGRQLHLCRGCGWGALRDQAARRRQGPPRQKGLPACQPAAIGIPCDQGGTLRAARAATKPAHSGTQPGEVTRRDHPLAAPRPRRATPGSQVWGLGTVVPTLTRPVQVRREPGSERQWRAGPAAGVRRWGGSRGMVARWCRALVSAATHAPGIVGMSADGAVAGERGRAGGGKVRVPPLDK